MIEATCAACGTLNRVPEDEVPPASRFITCTSCKSRVAIAAKPPAIKPPAIPKTPPPSKPMAIPSIKAKAEPPIELADLPAPKRSSPFSGAGESVPAPKPGLDLFADLPAPKTARATPSPLARDADLLVPKGAQAIIDLPTPKAIVDLPAPKGKTSSRSATPPTSMPAIALDLGDLPAPKPIAAKSQPGNLLDDLDLPRPKQPAAAPADIIDLPEPKGFIDLPQPKPTRTDMVAPKGFFDDLPQPAKARPAELPAPKGFFDDLPQPARAHPPELPAPKGFFDDLPQPAKVHPPELPAPKGFFDDLPQPAAANPPTVPPQQLRPAEGVSNSSIPIDLSPATSGSQPLDLDDPSAGPELDLELPEPPRFKPAGGAALPLQPPDGDDLGLAEPTKPPIRFDKGQRAGTAPIVATPASSPTRPANKGGDLRLELETDQPAIARAKVAEKKQVAWSADDSADRAKKRRTIVLAAVLAVIVLGAGGWFAYQKFIAEPKERAEQIDELLGAARNALGASDAKHWDRAVKAANAALEVDDSNAEALGIAAEASVAGAWESGTNIAVRVKRARELLRRANDAAVTGPRIARAQALVAMATGQQPELAVKKLQQMTIGNPKDPFLALYLAWAQVAGNDLKGAIATLALPAGDAKTKISALYARGNAYLGLADVAHAGADFSAILEASKDHVGAQVGLASTLPPAQAQERETRLRSITRRKDFEQTDERVRARVWTLVGDIDRQSGRLDNARDDYHRALAIVATDVGALTGLAATELRDGKLDLAADQINKALAQNGNDADAQLVFAELAIKQQRFDDVTKVIDKLSSRDPALPPLQAAHMHVVVGRLAEAQRRDDEAAAAFVVAAKLAGDLDLGPTMLAVTKLNALAKAASGDTAAKYAKQRDELLSALDERANDDPKLAMALGQAYLEAGDPQKAADKLRRAEALVPNDPQAKLQLGRALAQLGQLDESLKMLDAALDLDKSRFDIADEIAQTLENAMRTEQAAKAYAKLLSLPEVPVGGRVHAGKFYARIGDMKRAAEQGDLILAKEPDNSAGHYLRGEGQLAAGNLDNARREFQTAIAADPDNAQYLDAQGRAFEASYAKTTDGKFLDNAIHVYGMAKDKAPKMFNPWAGLARIYVQRREFEKAEQPLGKAYNIDTHAEEVLFNLGLTYIALQNHKLAITWFKLALGEKRRAETYYRLGELYRDPLVNQPIEALANLFDATRLGSEQEGASGKQIDWLTMAWYRLGQLYDQQTCAPKKPYIQFLNRHPASTSPESRAAEQWLGTNGRSC